MQIYNRKNKTHEPISQYGGNLLDILYNHFLGRVLLKLVIHPVFSRINGWYNSSSMSVKKIKPFVDDYGICLSDYEKREYTSFNDFFTRKIKEGKRVIDMKSSSLVAPADSKLSVYPVMKGNVLQIKGVTYTLDELVDGKIDLKDYEGGKCLVFRLTMDDYHRYIFIDNGKVKRRYGIKGKLHTVSSISKEHRIYRQNSRMVNLLKTENFGNVIFIEVGALLVGKIKNYKVNNFIKGQEKGYFELGGSTIITIFENNKIELDEDIVVNCDKDIEVKLQMGEKIGRKYV
ncbi:MAG: phosphatidylserine decarboxylase [Lachnospiraceae bacterium]|nr:phosphatidylserine decarboxylase [Lachnospiraceae bacterium]